MKYKFIEENLNYDGTQLQSLFAYMNYKIMGDSLLAFVGSCDISFEHMVDGEDVLAQSPIRGAKMLHFIIEEFGNSIELAVTRQRLFAAIALEVITKLTADRAGESVSMPRPKVIGAPEKSFSNLYRSGDDLYLEERKLSISIATVSPVSSLIHFAVNINNENTPVKTLSLQDLEIDPKKFSDLMAEKFLEEVKTIKEACCKVRWVK